MNNYYDINRPLDIEDVPIAKKIKVEDVDVAEVSPRLERFSWDHFTPLLPLVPILFAPEQMENESKHQNQIKKVQPICSQELSSRVFIPELLAIMFMFVTDIVDLSNCARVSKVWRRFAWSTITKLEFDRHQRTMLRLNDSILNFYSIECSRLRHLNLRYCRTITDVGIGYIAKGMPLLENLYISACDFVTDVGMQHIGQMRNLKQLYVSLCIRITDEGLRAISTLPELKELFLCGCYNISDNGLEYVGDLQSLEYLILSGCTLVSDIGISSLVGLPNMQNLNVMCCDKITDEGVFYMSKMTNLVTLNLSGCVNVTDNGMQHLLNLKNLEELNVMYCPLITSTGKQYLSHLPNLQTSELC